MILERMTPRQGLETTAWMERELLPDEREDLRFAKLAFAITHAPHGSRAKLSTFAEFFTPEPAAKPEPQTPRQMDRAFGRMNAIRRQASEN